MVSPTTGIPVPLGGRIDANTRIAYTRRAPKVPQTVVETETYLRDAHGVFGDPERSEIVAYVGSYPETGDVMPGTGGVRKLRWGIEGRGKRGGARVIYYFHNETIPVFLLGVFAKNEKANLSQSERNAFKRRTAELAKHGGLQ